MSTPSTPPPPLGRQRPPRVVAELGRPETPEETVARKALSSQNHRMNQTAKNLLLSIGASVAIVLVLVLVVVRPGGSQLHSVDYLHVASQAQQQVTEHLAAPKMPSGWSANDAEIRPAGADGVQTWYIGLLTPDTQFIGLTQGLDANPTWVSDQLQSAAKTSEKTVGGLDWSIYDHRTASNPGNLAYAMVTTSGHSTIILAGTASTKDFDLLAERSASEIQQ
jgi:Protein of unknown function (DUF4245)